VRWAEDAELFVFR
jgi:hypothetical protein